MVKKKKLNVIEYNGKLVVSSKEVAELLGKTHGSVLSTFHDMTEKGVKTPKEMRELYEYETKGNKTYRILMTEDGCKFYAEYRSRSNRTDKVKNAEFLTACKKAFRRAVKTNAMNEETKVVADSFNYKLPELLYIDYDGDFPTVSARELHEALGVETRFNDWFSRMCEYGFSEGKDFYSILSKSTGGRPSTDYNVTVSMAKELCMIQRNEKGKFFRQYFIKIEEMWNSPAYVMKRALEFANRQVNQLRIEVNKLEETVTEQQKQITVQTEQIAEMKPKSDYCNQVLNAEGLMTVTEIAKDYGKSAIWLNKFLHEKGVQFKHNGTWLLYQKYAEKGYAMTKTSVRPDKNGINREYTNTYWNQKGRMFIHDLLAKDGIFPISVQEEPEKQITVILPETVETTA